MESYSKRARSLFYRALIIIIIACAFLRALHPSADPPVDLSWSGGYFADEGFWVHNARNQILFGEAVTNDWNDMYLSPITYWLAFIAFKLFGIGLWQARIISIVLSSFSILLIALALSLRLSERTALYAAVFWGFSFVPMMYGRLYLLETPLVFFISLALFLYLMGERFPPGYLLCGVALGCAYSIKSLAVYLIVASLASLILMFISQSQRSLKDLLRNLGFICAGFLMIIIPLYLLFYLPHWELVSGYNRYYLSQQSASLSGIAKDVLTQPFFIYASRFPVITALGMVGLISLFDKLYRKRANTVEILLFCWFILGFVMLSMFHYRPVRYYLPIFLALHIMAALGLERLFDLLGGDVFQRVLWSRGRKAVLLVIFIIIAGSLGGFMLLAPRLGVSKDLLAYVYKPGFYLSGFTLGLVGYYVLRLAGNKDSMQHQRLIYMALISIFVIHNALQYVNWARAPKYTIRSASLKLEMLAPGGRVAGQWAPQLCMNNQLRCYPMWLGYVNHEDALELYDITHILLWSFNDGLEEKNFRIMYPRALKQGELIETFIIKQSEVKLYKLPNN